MRSRRTTERHGGEQSEPMVNLTPLIDVVFVILIAFIVVAPLLERDEIDLPPASHLMSRQSLRELSPIVLRLRKDRTIWLGAFRVDEEQLGELLRKEKAEHPDETPQLLCDCEAPYGLFQKVKNRLEEAGFHKMEVILQ